MEVNVTEHDKFVSLAPQGEMDANTSLLVDEKIQEWIDKNQFNFHVDCSELQYISSAGVGVFLSFQDEVESNAGKFVFSNMSENIFQVFELLGLHLFMKIVPTQAEAEKEFVE
jgi:anti-sigma B factor antagonist